MEDEFAEYVPAVEQGSLLWAHKVESGLLTQRSLLPVSRCIRTVCPGVPNVPFTKYRVSYGEVSQR